MRETENGIELGVAIVGAGFMGDTHSYGYHRVRSLRAPPGILPNVRTVVDIDAEAAQSLADRWDVPEWSTDWKTVLDADGIDLVDICTRLICTARSVWPWPKQVRTSIARSPWDGTWTRPPRWRRRYERPGCSAMSVSPIGGHPRSFSPRA